MAEPFSGRILGIPAVGNSGLYKIFFFLRHSYVATLLSAARGGSETDRSRHSFALFSWLTEASVKVLIHRSLSAKLKHISFIQ